MKLDHVTHPSRDTSTCADSGFVLKSRPYLSRIALTIGSFQQELAIFPHLDTPEKAQLHGKEALAVLSSWLLNKEVQLEPFEQDRYDRLVATVYSDERNINAELVRAGHAWVYRRYTRKQDAALCDDESEARSTKRGLWALPENEWIASWEYRSRKKRDSFTDYSRETTPDCVAALGKRSEP